MGNRIQRSIYIVRMSRHRLSDSRRSSELCRLKRYLFFQSWRWPGLLGWLITLVLCSQHITELLLPSWSTSHRNRESVQALLVYIRREHRRCRHMRWWILSVCSPPCIRINSKSSLIFRRGSLHQHFPKNTGKCVFIKFSRTAARCWGLNRWLRGTSRDSLSLSLGRSWQHNWRIWWSCQRLLRSQIRWSLLRWYPQLRNTA